MSPSSSRGREPGMAASGARAARRMAAQAGPLARSTGAAAARRVHGTRAWAAPRVERTGQVLQHSVAPRVSALLSAAARRIEPAERPRRRWRTLAGVSLLTAAAGAAAVLLRKLRKPDPAPPEAEADTDDVTPAAQTRNGQAGTSADADATVNESARVS